MDAARVCATAPERSTNAQIVTATYTGGKGHNAAGIRRRAATFGYSPAEREGADAGADYLTAKKEYLDYATALAKGWPIATSVIERAARWLVKDRMDIPSARWGLQGAEAILKTPRPHRQRR